MADIDERFAPWVRDRGEHHLRVAALLTGDWHAAEDLVQASLVKLYRAWPKLRPGGDPDAYLRRIMVNTYRSWWRARWRRETPAGELPETVIADFADGQALAAQVRQALPRQQRAVLVLRYFADLPEAEVADLIGCSPGTVKTHAHRGLRALRVISRITMNDTETEARRLLAAATQDMPPGIDLPGGFAGPDVQRLREAGNGHSPPADQTYPLP